MESNPIRVIPLLGISSPCQENILFQVQGAHGETVHHRDRVEESRVVALVLLCIHVLECFKLSIYVVRVTY